LAGSAGAVVLAVVPHAAAVSPHRPGGTPSAFERGFVGAFGVLEASPTAYVVEDPSAIAVRALAGADRAAAAARAAVPAGGSSTASLSFLEAQAHLRAASGRPAPPATADHSSAAAPTASQPAASHPAPASQPAASHPAPASQPAASHPAPASSAAPAGPKSLGEFVVTCYDIHGTTASGAPASLQSVAVDPAVIPLGTTITIQGVGTRIADDTGGAIVGHRLDIWEPTAAQCDAFGVQTLEVWLGPTAG